MKFTNVFCMTFILFNSLNLFTDVESSIVAQKCDYVTRDKCIENWPCMWCNYTRDIDNTTLLDYTGGGGMIEVYSQCRTIAPCEFNISHYSNCEFKDSSRYIRECKLMLFVLYILMFVGYYVSMIIIYGTVNRILVSEEVSNSSRSYINTIVLVLLSIPLFIFMFYDLYVFYTIFLTYMLVSICSYCCIKVKDRDTNMNVVAQKDNAPAYTRIN